MEVDLFTDDWALEDAFLAEYPERFFERNQRKYDFPGGRLYRFNKLDLDALAKFLLSREFTNYQVRESKTGKLVDLNKTYGN